MYLKSCFVIKELSFAFQHNVESIHVSVSFTTYSGWGLTFLFTLQVWIVWFVWHIDTRLW